MKFAELVDRITPRYDANEARSIMKLLLEKLFGLSFVDVCLGALGNLSDEQHHDLDAAIIRLEAGEPVQYVLGRADFYGREFHVEKGVLIPRPETEELIDWIKEECKEDVKYQLLDIGCGSGCISITTSLELPHAEVTAWDVLDVAIEVTKTNASRLEAAVSVVRQDALRAPEDDLAKWDVIVSNPPYVCSCEADAMSAHVLDYEPHIALFVPDDDPLLFYRSIAHYASHALKPDGLLFFEINEAYGNETMSMLSALGYADVQLRRDCFGKDRMVMARKSQQL